MSEDNISEPKGIEGKTAPLYSGAKAYQTLTRKYFPILSQLHDVQSFRMLKVDVLSAGQKLVLQHALSPKKLEKAGFLQLIQGFEILNKAERLELGKTTENVGNMVFGKVRVEHFTQNEDE